MIDIHSHILYGIDDGVKTIDESIKILKNFSLNGVTDVIFTPHYIEYSSYVSNKENNIKRLNKLKQELENNNIDINVYLGNEIYINHDIEKLLDQNEISALNGSDYLLIELPMSGEYRFFMDIFLELIDKGKKVILAHPERYAHFYKHFDELIDIHNSGILFQVNYESINGKYGSHAKKTLKKLLKNNLVDFVGSDIHRHKEDYSSIRKARKKFNKYTSLDNVDKIFNENAKEIIKNIKTC